MKVNVNRVLAIKAELKVINKANLEDIQWIKDGTEIPITQEQIDAWEFIGLNNVDFITSEFYNEKEK